MESILEEILNLTKKKMHEQGAFSRDEYKNLISETIDYYLSKGKLTDDDNLTFIEDRLLDMYGVVRDEMSDDNV
ncbi:hypothetical protein KAR28_01840 [Candidatus Parcubacteria bacterium]|nr:hypothetical protein [Candidatus Parcubacteria bacterium]